MAEFPYAYLASDSHRVGFAALLCIWSRYIDLVALPLKNIRKNAKTFRLIAIVI